VNCDTQEEIDYYWDSLSNGGKTDSCGWLTDKYGVSWQIVPSILPELLNDSDPAKPQRVMSALLQMDKLDIEKLKKVFSQEEP
jgi:predicted 3-demethylubiquinone-9 3-methyltransferase (glyoxalase superfamily)